MKCKRVQELAGAYLYGDLAPDEMREVRLHTQDCDACRADVESRGKVVSSLSDKAPELSDQERMEIAWAVKGAIRNGAHAREPRFGWGYVAAVASVLLAGLAVAAIVVSNSGKPPPSGLAGVEPPRAAVVEITEEPVACPSKRTPERAPSYREETTPRDESPSDRTVRDLRRELTSGLAVLGNRGHKGTHRRQEKSAPLATPDEPKPEEPKPAPIEEGSKLPEPTDPNDAHTGE